MLTSTAVFPGLRWVGAVCMHRRHGVCDQWAVTCETGDVRTLIHLIVVRFPLEDAALCFLFVGRSIEPVSL